MQIRCRWYQIKIPRGIPDLTDFLEQFDRDDRPYRFTRLDSSTATPRFRFLWPEKVIVTRIDDQGNPAYESVSSVRFTDFALMVVDGQLFMRVENPARSLRELFNALETEVGLGFSSRPITLERWVPTDVFESVDAARLVGIRVSGVMTAQKIAARMEFSSEGGIQVEKIPEVKNMNYVIDLSEYDLFHQGLKAHLVISVSGLVKLSGALSPRILHLIEQGLARI